MRVPRVGINLMTPRPNRVIGLGIRGRVNAVGDTL